MTAGRARSKSNSIVHWNVSRTSSDSLTRNRETLVRCSTRFNRTNDAMKPLRKGRARQRSASLRRKN